MLNVTEVIRRHGTFIQRCFLGRINFSIANQIYQSMLDGHPSGYTPDSKYFNFVD